MGELLEGISLQEYCNMLDTNKDDVWYISIAREKYPIHTTGDKQPPISRCGVVAVRERDNKTYVLDIPDNVRLR